jgi:uncharacterized GH25 family protein
MTRLLSATLAGLLIAATAHAHFVYVLPDKSGAKAVVVFSDNLEPDDAVDVTKIGGTKLVVRDAAGKESPLEMTKGEHQYTVALSGSGPRVVYGTTEYGVMKRGDSKPFRLVYHPKAIVGSAFAEVAKLGPAAPVEIVPVADGTQARFLVLAQGKPVAAAEVSLILPGGARKKVTTDADGRTPAFADAGRYGLMVRHVEPTAGERDGQKFEEVRRYATLVVDLDPAKK